jgi:hypothetical protein
MRPAQMAKVVWWREKVLVFQWAWKEESGRTEPSVTSQKHHPRAVMVDNIQARVDLT